MTKSVFPITSSTTTTHHTGVGKHTDSRSFAARHVAQFKEHLATRKALRQFRRELDTYATPAQINDLLALLSEHDDPESQEMRGLLVSNLNHRS